MKRFFNKAFIVAAMSSMMAASCDSNNMDTGENTGQSVSVSFAPDTESNLKNPYMGWTLYSEGGQNTDRPEPYWYMQDEAAEKYAGVFYIRWRWSDLEPEEGKYAWEHNEDFKGLVQGALDRNLRLAFRIYVNGRDNLKPATPQYVLDGAETYTVAPGHQTPYPDDEFFLEKYIKFIEAFGKKYNDPAIVDYVDSYGLGFWGEEHNITYKDPLKKYDTHDRIVRAYEKAFDKVINVINFGVRDATQEAVVYDELGFTSRRDGYVSSYFPVSQQKELVKRFPATPIIAEACYWGGTGISTVEGGKYPSWGEYYDAVVAQSIETHANYLDLRTPTEASRYLSSALDAVKLFVSKGGYRIYPTTVGYEITAGTLTVSHSWKNLGVGVLPNNNVHLRYKYKIMFGLFDENDKLVKSFESKTVEVSELVGGEVFSGEDAFALDGIPSGKYKLAAGIVNTIPNDSKDIALAVKNPKKISGEWIYVSDLNIQ